MSRVLLLATFALLAFAAAPHEQSPQAAHPQINDPVGPDQVGPLMRRKLDRSKAILEGLTLEQFDKIASSARSLKLLSSEAGWNIVQTEEYRQQSDDFRRACDQIESAAKAKDVHRAALAYVTLTVRCVECHSYMRENKIKLAASDFGRLHH